MPKTLKPRFARAPLARACKKQPRVVNESRRYFYISGSFCGALGGGSLATDCPFLTVDVPKKQPLFHAFFEALLRRALDIGPELTCLGINVLEISKSDYERGIGKPQTTLQGEQAARTCLLTLV